MTIVRRFIAVISCLCAISAAGVTGVSGSTQATSYGAGSFMWPSSPGPGHLGLYIDDSISHTRRVSTLSNASGGLCGSLTDAKCAGTAAWVYAIIPPCGGTVQVDCIANVGSRSKSGVIDTGSFSRYFPDKGLADFVGDPVAKVPNGGAPSVWSLPGTPHVGGTDYLAVVAVSGTSGVNRDGLQSPTLMAALYPIREVTGRFARNVPAGGRGVSHPSTDLWSNCASLGDGTCAARQPFPADTAFSMSLRLSTAPTGWLHGRIFAPSLDYSTSNGVTNLTVEASPALVPAVATWAKIGDVPSGIPTMGCSPTSNCGQSNPQAAGAHVDVERWRSLYGDKAAWVRSHWNFSSLNERLNPTTPMPGSGGATSCLSDASVLHGVVTTNATGYVAGPPEYSPTDKTFTYTVASPHVNEAGVVIRGTYSLAIRSETARCIYGVMSGFLSARVSVVQQDGSDQSSSTVVNVADDGQWLRILASGFHYSSPMIKAALTTAQEATTGSSNWYWPSQNEVFETLPVATSRSNTPANSAKKAVATMRRGKSVSTATLVKLSSLKAPKGSRVSVAVAVKSKKICRTTPKGLLAVKRGPCSVRVSVRTKTGKVTSRSIVVTVK